MNNAETETLLEQVSAGTVSPRTAIATLVNGGEDRVDAEQMVFAALGGSDLAEVGDDGRERYMPSGKLVREVAAAMAK